MSPPCAGFIVFTKNKDKVLLVVTHRNVIGFFKGKKRKNEDSLMTAYRELQEETGLSHDMIEKIDNLYVNELSFKGNPATRLYLGYLSIEKPQLKAFDVDEIAHIYFENIEDALISLLPKRKKVLSEAISLINQYHTQKAHSPMAKNDSPV